MEVGKQLYEYASGIYYPDEGDICIHGKAVTICAQRLLRWIGMIHQHFKLIDIPTAAENIILGLPGEKN